MGGGENEDEAAFAGGIGTFLENLCAVHLDQAQVGILVFFAVTHAGRDLVWRVFVIGLVAVWPSSLRTTT